MYPWLLKKFNYKDFLLHFNHALYQLKLLSVQCRQVFILSKFLSHKQRVSQVGLLFLQVDITINKRQPLGYHENIIGQDYKNGGRNFLRQLIEFRNI